MATTPITASPNHRATSKGLHQHWDCAPVEDFKKQSLHGKEPRKESMKTKGKLGCDVIELINEAVSLAVEESIGKLGGEIRCSLLAYDDCVVSVFDGNSGKEFTGVNITELVSGLIKYTKEDDEDCFNLIIAAREFEKQAKLLRESAEELKDSKGKKAWAENGTMGFLGTPKPSSQGLESIAEMNSFQP
jgi:hypothetical protein